MPTVNRMTGGFWDVHQGSDYTAAEVEFMMAMHSYIRRSGNKFPDCCEVLAVAKALGYERVVDVKPVDVIFMGM